MRPTYTKSELAEIAQRTTELLIAPFPQPPDRLQTAFNEMKTANVGTPAQKLSVNGGEGIPRPWIPWTCTRLGLREDLFAWLDEVVKWLNQQYTWDTAMMIPPCWPMHPHIINELVVVADLRRLAEEAKVSEQVHKWHNDVLPGFFDRMKQRLGHSCDDGEHTPWPGNPRFRTYIGEASHDLREARIRKDLDTQRRLNAIRKQALRRRSVDDDQFDPTDGEPPPEDDEA